MAAGVALVHNGVKRFRRPEMGRLNLHFELMDLSSAPELVVGVYQPADQETGRALAGLRRRHPPAAGKPGA